MPGAIVLLCFEKSMWMSVAALAAMKAGAAMVAMDTAQPEERLRAIMAQAKSSKSLLLLSSEANDALARRFGADEVVLVRPDQLLRAPGPDSEQPPERSHELPAVSPSDVLYIAFTSGSTGKLKGAMITHRNMCSAMAHQQDALGFASNSRVLDFSSYAFDIVWSNLLNTLTAGGCLCPIRSRSREQSLRVSGEIQDHILGFDAFGCPLRRAQGSTLQLVCDGPRGRSSSPQRRIHGRRADSG